MYQFIGSQRGVAAYFWIAGLGMGDWGIVIVSSLEMLCIGFSMIQSVELPRKCYVLVFR